VWPKRVKIVALSETIRSRFGSRDGLSGKKASSKRRSFVISDSIGSPFGAGSPPGGFTANTRACTRSVTAR